MAVRYAVRAEHTAEQLIDGEAVVINFDTYHYYGLNGTATAIWSLLKAGGREPAELASALSTAFQAPLSTVSPDVDRAIAALLDEGLIETTDAAAEVAAEVAATSAYVAPQLEKHGKLDQLMLSGE
jgi:hypothetical protein